MRSRSGKAQTCSFNGNSTALHPHQQDLKSLVLATGRFNPDQVMARDQQSVYAIAARPDGPELTLAIVQKEDRALVFVHGIPRLDENRHRVLLATVDLIDHLIKDSIKITTYEGFIRMGIVAEPITASRLRDACDTAMTIGTDIARFLLAALEMPALREDPRCALRSFLAYVNDPQRGFPSVPEGEEQDEAVQQVRVN